MRLFWVWFSGGGGIYLIGAEGSCALENLELPHIGRMSPNKRALRVKVDV